MNNVIKTFAFLLLTQFSIAQSNTTAKIDKLTTGGLHKIVLPTAIRSISKNDLSDFRILDNKNNEVPYFYENATTKSLTKNFVEFKIISEQIIPKKQTTIIFENPEKNLSSVTISVANYDGEKQYNLSGSDDQKKWYGLANNQILNDLNESNDLKTSKTISFPKNNYKYIKIELDDKKTLPISVKSIGNDNFKTTFSELLPINLASKKIEEIKSEKLTKIHLFFNSEETLNQIKFTVTEPKFYRRNAIIYKIVNTKVKHKFIDKKIEIFAFELNSETQNTFILSDFHEKEFYIEIENNDNPPLIISDINFYQIPVFVIADLKANENYTITTGNKDAIAPNYDINNFKNSISGQLPIANIIEVVLPKLNANTTTQKSFWSQPWFMWALISVGGLVVLYFTISLLKDLSKTKS